MSASSLNVSITDKSNELNVAPLRIDSSSAKTYRKVKKSIIKKARVKLRTISGIRKLWLRKYPRLVKGVFFLRNIIIKGQRLLGLYELL